MSTEAYHIPVMLKECIEGLEINPDGIYVDVTFGGGGHSREIVKHLKKGHLYAFDQDPDAWKNAEDFDEDRFTLIQGNFRHLSKYLRANGIKEVDGILADLGVSSHQFNTAERGFSFRFDGPLDMRMGQNGDKTAEQIVNEYSEADLHKLLGMYGELTNAKTAANAIVRARSTKRLTQISQLIEALRPVSTRGKENKYFAQVFQSLRIEVNEEMKALEEFLEQTTTVLKKEGRLVVMSYHSLEDRLVKNYIREGLVYGQAQKNIYGIAKLPLEAVNRKPIEPSEEELVLNSRSRSAKLRVAFKK